MKCPVCRATYRPAESNPVLSTADSEANCSAILSCRRCGADLTDLIRLHDQAVWHYRQALDLLQSDREAEALAANEQALALDRRNADFHALAGQLFARQGEFERAIAAWQQALQLSPQHPTAKNYLQTLMEVKNSSAIL